jgi:hypothetical protein
VVIARRLADELDTAELAPYVVPRLAASLLAVVADIESAASDTSRPTRPTGGSRPDLHRLLRDVQ